MPFEPLGLAWKQAWAIDFGYAADRVAGWGIAEDGEYGERARSECVWCRAMYMVSSHR